jgi:cytochrome c peroxidase
MKPCASHKRCTLTEARLWRIALALGLSLLVQAASATPAEEFSPAERERIASHGPWPQAWSPDPGNRASGNAAAIRLGHDLFFEPRLSANGRVGCATCHHPAQGFQDGRATGARPRSRHTQHAGLAQYVVHQRWFGWDGGHDNLWSASLRPILDPREMGGSAARTAQVLRSDAALACHYTEAFGKVPVPVTRPCWPMSPRQSPPGRKPWSRRLLPSTVSATRWRAGMPRPRQPIRRLRSGDCACSSVAASAPPAMPGRCSATANSATSACPSSSGRNGVDPGRQGGIKRLLANPYNLLGTYNDDATRDNATGTRFLRPEHRNFGEFKVPTLRNLILTAPYMHNGSLATLRDVVRHYSELDEDRLHADGERILKPLRLSQKEGGDLVAFLESLSPDRPQPAPASPPAAPGCGR